jgi:hypothetical protein
VELLRNVRDRKFLLYFCLAAMKIHISSQTKEILDLFGTFLLEARGLVSMKVRDDVEFRRVK